MGIYGAINSAVSGLAAQATALENISGNVANSQTTGYKRLDTTFSDLVSGGGAKQAQQVSGTTFATSRATNTVQGDITSSTSIPTCHQRRWLFRRDQGVRRGRRLDHLRR